MDRGAAPRVRALAVTFALLSCLLNALAFQLPPFPPKDFLSHDVTASPPQPAAYMPNPPPRLVAIGDLHGDLSAALATLELAGVVAPGHGGRIDRTVWAGGDTLVVQMGDFTDRGPSEIKILLLMRWLASQARREGGDVVMLLGNHDAMQVAGDFRYVHRMAYQETAALLPGLTDEQRSSPEALRQARRMLWGPGAPVAAEMAWNPTVLVVGDTLFVHGGLLPGHLDGPGLQGMNDDVAAWMWGAPVERPAQGHGSLPSIYADLEGPFWQRLYSNLPSNFVASEACPTLQETLQRVSDSWPGEGGPVVRRIVMGHTPQVELTPGLFGSGARLLGINAVCDGAAWRIDAGLSAGMFGADPEVLEVTWTDRDDGGAASTVRVIRSDGGKGKDEL